MTPPIPTLHNLYQTLTGRSYDLGYFEQYCWHEFLKHGWTEADLKLVVRWLDWKIKRGERRIESLRLGNLLDVTRFMDDLQDARGWARKPPESARTAILEASHRPETSQANVKPVGDVAKHWINEMRKAVG